MTRIVNNLSAKYITLSGTECVKLSFRNTASTIHNKTWIELIKYTIPRAEWQKAQHIERTQIATRYMSKKTKITKLDFLSNFDLGYMPEYINIKSKIALGINTIYDTNVNPEFIYVYRIIIGEYIPGASDNWVAYGTNYVSTMRTTEMINYSDEYEIDNIVVDDIAGLGLSTMKHNPHLLMFNDRFRGGIEKDKYVLRFRNIEYHLLLLTDEAKHYQEDVDEFVNSVYNRFGS